MSQTEISTMTTEESQTNEVEKTEVEKIEVEKTEVETQTIEERIQDLITNLEALGKSARTMATELRCIKKDVIKEARKKSSGKKKKRVIDPNKARKEPSGFARPTKISDELADFLGSPRGELLARTEVTKRLTIYIKERDLQLPANRRQIDLTKPEGADLKKLLNPDQTLTFFNLQRYLKPHFPPSKAALAKAAKLAAKTDPVSEVDNVTPAPLVNEKTVVTKARTVTKKTRTRTKA